MPIKQNSNSIAQSIINTICYADLFNYPLTRGEVYQYLISNQAYSKSITNSTLSKLIASKLIVASTPQKRVGELSKLFALPGRQKLFSLRIKRFHTSKKKLKKTRRVGKWLKKIPMIKAIFITGTLAMENASSIDDMDLMIVTSPHKLWQTRALTIVALETLKVRRKPEHVQQNQVKDKICPNLFLSQDNLKLSKNKQNLYSAHEVVQAKVLFDKDNIHQEFLSANSWTTTFLPHYSPPSPNFILKNDKKNIYRPNVSNFIEKLAYKAQIKYMQKKRTSETITPNSAFFHPRNTSQLVLSQYKSLIKQHQL